MDGSKACLLKAFLTGLALLCMAPWVPHMYSSLTWFLVTLPSVASTIVAPKCLFVFSNIIVLFLASELKITEGSSYDNYVVSTIHEATVLALPVLEGKDTGHVSEESKEEQANMAVINETPLEDQCVEEEVSVVVGTEDIREESSNSVLVEESQEYQEEEQKYDEELEEMNLPTDELNQRVEDFISRFNMERQLEARMILCCC